MAESWTAERIERLRRLALEPLAADGRIDLLDGRHLLIVRER
jgi:hypothetical protein